MSNQNVLRYLLLKWQTVHGIMPGQWIALKLFAATVTAAVLAPNELIMVLYDQVSRIRCDKHMQSAMVALVYPLAGAQPVLQSISFHSSLQQLQALRRHGCPK